MGSLNQNCIGVEHSGELVTFDSKRIEPLKSLKVYFSPVQEGEGDPSPENIRNIVGREGVVVNNSDFLITENNTEWQNGYVGSGGGITNSNNEKVTGFIPAKPKTTYHTEYVYTGTGRAWMGIGFYDENKKFISRDSAYVKVRNTLSPNNTAYMRISITTSNLLFELKCYNNNKETISIDWSDEYGTIYGGYVDLVSGKLTATWKRVSIQNVSWSRYHSTVGGIDAYAFTTTATDHKPVGLLEPSNIYCDIYKTVNALPISSIRQIPQYGICCRQTYTTIMLRDDRYSSVEDFVQNVSGYIVYELASPIVYQMTPRQIQTLIGQNNIWSNTDSVTAETYYIEPVQQTYKKFFYNEPHIVSASGDLITFDTDMKAPLKECKIGFSPIQLGEGDPSPENVREIQGWDGINICDLGSNNIFNWNVERSYPSETSSPNTNKRLFVPNTYIIGMSSGNYYRHDYSNWVLNPSVSDGVVSFESNIATGYGIAFVFRLKAGETYRCSYTGKGNVYFAYYAEDGSYLGQAPLMYKSATIPTKAVTTLLCFMGSASNTVFTFSDIQLEVGSTPTQYSDFDGASKFISWKDQYGIIYGGYLDLVNGEVVAEWITNKIATMGWNNYSVKIRYYANVRLQDTVEYDREKNSYIYSDTLTPRSDGQFGKADVGYLTYYGTETTTGSYYNSVWITLPEAMERDEARQWIAETYPDATICYKLATPIHYPLTPQILKTLKGTNNIWSSANGDLEIKYYKH